MRLSGSSSSRPLASLIVIVASPGSSSIAKPSCGPAERGDGTVAAAPLTIMAGRRSSLCDRFMTCGRSSGYRDRFCCPKVPTLQVSPAPVPRQNAIPHKPASPSRPLVLEAPSRPCLATLTANAASTRDDVLSKDDGAQWRHHAGQKGRKVDGISSCSNASVPGTSITDSRVWRPHAAGIARRDERTKRRDRDRSRRGESAGSC
jgi:hypothetical protein